MQILHSSVYSGILIALTISLATPSSSLALGGLTADLQSKSDAWREIAEKAGEERRQLADQLPVNNLPQNIRETLAAPIGDAASGVQQPGETPQPDVPPVTESQSSQSTTPPLRAKKPLVGQNLKACQGRENAIRSLMTKTVTRSEHQLTVFTQIADRTKAFHEQQGRTLENYDALVQEVAMRKVLAEDAVEATRQTGSNFECEGTHPKVTIVSFKDQLHLQQQLMNDYRTAIKNLIQSVKSVQPDTTEKSTPKEDARHE